MTDEPSLQQAAPVGAEPDRGSGERDAGGRPSSRLLVALAVVAWVPVAVRGLHDGAGAGYWGLFSALIGTTASPLALPGGPVFRNACLAVGWLQFGIEIVLSVPFMLLAVPWFVFVFPSGVVLLLASRRGRGTVGTAVPVLLAACPILLLAHGEWTRLG
ncbi:hypothetical protein AB0C76_24290 [Kitasatospora sp. NPDC048722]|uniref:hypothetical protein n=1 Tax=Kitasatospora sp. NPDC048722 TaxID=3155639 RepID=UPI0034054B3A